MHTIEQFEKALSYDPETGEFRWLVRRGSAAAGTFARPEVTGKGYHRIRFMGAMYRAHRLAWLFTYRVWPQGQLDHIDGDKSNNRVANLRNVSGAHNCQNLRRPRCTNKSGLLGVITCGKKWEASIWVNGTKRYLGTFENPEVAHEAYMAAKRELHPGFVPCP